MTIFFSIVYAIIVLARFGFLVDDNWLERQRMTTYNDVIGSFIWCSVRALFWPIDLCMNLWRIR